ncbi:MAG: PDC sensor domain-containing protein, partial [Oscillospiraceae bacterium]
MKKGKSALFSLTIAILIIVFAQIALIGGTLIASGVISKLDDNAYEIFSQTVRTRASYVESEMYNRWSEIDAFANDLAISYPADVATDGKRLAYLETAAPTLITMLRETDATGAFLILDDNKDPDSAHSCLYFIDGDPGYNDLQNNSDLMLLKGPVEFLKKFQIPLHIAWNYGITLDDSNRDLFDRPYFAGKTLKTTEHLGYWSISDSFADPEAKVITYTKPLISADGEVFGVAGVEISQDYLYRLLPREELSNDSYNGYAIVGDSADGIEPLIVQGAMLRKALPYGKNLNMQLKNEATGSYSIWADGMRLSGHLEQLPLYNRNTPFSGTRWYVLGVARESSLTRYSENLTKTLTTAMSASLLIGIIFAVLMGLFFSKPLKELATQIHSFRPGDKLRLTPTGILEIDA